MKLSGFPVVALALLAGACSPGVSGRVEDAASGEPVAGAVVELGNVGWGTRDGQLVWDAPQVARTTTDAEGRFAFREDGGTLLRVSAKSAQTEARLCSRSPMVVRVGGATPDLRADQRLVFGPTDDAAGTPAARLGLRASGSALNGGNALRIEATGGVRFVGGVGAIPAAPRSRWVRTIEIDVIENCGWLYVSDGTSPVAVIEVAAPGVEQEPDGTRRFVMLFTPLPRTEPDARR